MAVLFPVLSHEISFVIPGGNDRAVGHGKRAKHPLPEGAPDSESPVTPIRSRTDGLNIAADIQKSGCDSILFQKRRGQISRIALPDRSQIQLHSLGKPDLVAV